MLHNNLFENFHFHNIILFTYKNVTIAYGYAHRIEKKKKEYSLIL